VANNDTEEAKKEIERLAREQANKEAKEAKQSKKEAERLAKEEAKQKAEDEKRFKGAEARAKKEAEKLAKEQAKKEAEEAKQAKKGADSLAKEQAKKEAEEAKQAKKGADSLAKEQAKKAKEELAPDVKSATYEGKYQLVLPSSAGFKHVNQFTQRLAGIKGVEVVWTGGSLDEGTLITVSVAQETPLARILSEMPVVEGVEVNGEKITVTLKGAI